MHAGVKPCSALLSGLPLGKTYLGAVQDLLHLQQRLLLVFCHRHGTLFGRRFGDFESCTDNDLDLAELRANIRSKGEISVSVKALHGPGKRKHNSLRKRKATLGLSSLTLLK